MKMDAIMQFIQSCLPASGSHNLTKVYQFVMQIAVMEVVEAVQNLPHCGFNYALKLSREGCDPMFFVPSMQGAVHVHFEKDLFDVWEPDGKVQHLTDFFQQSLMVQPAINHF